MLLMSISILLGNAVKGVVRMKQTRKRYTAMILALLALGVFGLMSGIP